MKILTISDEECPALWDYYQPGRLDDYDLILSCGDLNSNYLSFLVTMAKCPVLYVPGNHDRNYDIMPPEGCDCIDGHIVTFNGVRILGLGGCRKYHRGPHQYTDREMRRRIAKLRYQLWRMKGVDIVVTHAAPEGLGDDEDRAHWGFPCLRAFIDKYHPQYLVHGHVHMSYNHTLPRVMEHNGTQVVNAYERYAIEISEGTCKAKDFGQVIYKTRHPAMGPGDVILKH